MRLGALILAAGFSRRLGRPKQDVLLQGETLLARVVRTAHEAGLDPVLVVVREASHIEAMHVLGATPLLNERADEGMATSVVTGVTEAQRLGLQGLVLMTCDQPTLTAEHLRKLWADVRQVTASQYAGRNGVPAFFPSSTFEALLQLRGDAGARGLLQGVAAVRDESLALDIDTEDDLRHALLHLHRQSTRT